MSGDEDPDPLIEYLTSLRDIDGRYVNLAPLGNGRGGRFSLTLTADDVDEGDSVVLKFLDPLYERDYRGACFRREAEIALALKGREHIVQLRGLPADFVVLMTPPGRAKPIPFPLRYYVMERASGSFTGYLLGGRQPGLRRRIEVVRDVVRGVNRLHRTGYCHRDLKPDNILMFAGGGAKLGDLGTCRLLDGDDPALEVDYYGPQGDLGYTAPELLFGGWNNRKLFVSADWFSCGSVLFEALTGVNLYVSIGLRNSIHQVIDTFRGLPDTERLESYDRHVDDIAGRFPVPSLFDFASTSDCLAEASPATLVALDKLVRGLTNFNYRQRLARFEDALRGIDIVLGHIAVTERRRALVLMRGRDPSSAITQAGAAVVSRVRQS